MSTTPTFPALLERFFTQRLMQQRQASTHTIASYRDTFRLLLQFAQKRLRKAPCSLLLEDIDAPIVVDFLDELEKLRDVTARTRNLRLTAIRSFFRYVAFEAPAHAAQTNASSPSRPSDLREPWCRFCAVPKSMRYLPHRINAPGPDGAITPSSSLPC